MSLLERITGRKKRQSDEETGIQATENRSVVDQNQIEKAIAERASSIRLEDCLKVSFSEILALGAGFSELLPAFRTITQTATISGIGYIPMLAFTLSAARTRRAIRSRSCSWSSGRAC